MTSKRELEKMIEKVEAQFDSLLEKSNKDAHGKFPNQKSRKDKHKPKDLDGLFVTRDVFEDRAPLVEVKKSIKEVKGKVEEFVKKYDERYGPGGRDPTDASNPYKPPQSLDIKRPLKDVPYKGKDTTIGTSEDDKWRDSRDAKLLSQLKRKKNPEFKNATEERKENQELFQKAKASFIAGGKEYGSVASADGIPQHVIDQTVKEFAEEDSGQKAKLKKASESQIITTAIAGEQLAEESKKRKKLAQVIKSVLSEDKEIQELAKKAGKKLTFDEAEEHVVDSAIESEREKKKIGLDEVDEDHLYERTKDK